MSKSTQYLTEEEVFAMARKAAEDMTQNEVAEALDVSGGSVSKMMNGKSKMLSLAVRWIEMRIQVLDWHIESNEEGKPVRYYKAVQNINDNMS